MPRFYAGFAGHLKSLQASADGDFFQEASEHGLTVWRQGSRDDHPLGLDAAKFSRSEIGYDDDLAPDERLRRIDLGDAGDDLADFGADVNLEF
jgi:hypothetical protein